MSGFDGDLEDWSSENDESDFFTPTTTLGNMNCFAQKAVEIMYKTKYQKPRQYGNQLRHPTTDMCQILNVDKHEKPKDFQLYLCVNPLTFDHLVNVICQHLVFYNNSPNGQMPVKDQLAIALFCFGHFGNAAGIPDQQSGSMGWILQGYSHTCYLTCNA
jgi:hypothetical protein